MRKSPKNEKKVELLLPTSFCSTLSEKFIVVQQWLGHCPSMVSQGHQMLFPRAIVPREPHICITSSPQKKEMAQKNIAGVIFRPALLRCARCKYNGFQNARLVCLFLSVPRAKMPSYIHVRMNTLLWSMSVHAWSAYEDRYVFHCEWHDTQADLIRRCTSCT